MSIRIIADSACDITDTRARLEIIPMTVTIDGKEYLDGVSMSKEKFYEKLVETDGLPTTSQINPVQFSEAFRSAVERGDDIVVVTLSSKLSGTYESAVTAAQEFAGRVRVVDSQSAAMGEAILVERALQLASSDLDIDEIANALDNEKKDICLIALLDTLEYLKRGGRIPAAAATFGEMLSIKPVIAIEEGEVALLGKARGSRKGNNLLMEHIGKTKGIDFTRPYLLGYSGFGDRMLKKYIDDSRALWEGHTSDLPASMIGATIGTHIGPGAIGLAFFQNNV